MTTKVAPPAERPSIRGLVLASLIGLILAFPIVNAGTASAADPTGSTPSRVKTNQGWLDQGSWLKRPLIFLVISLAGGYVCYFGLYPKLLRKPNPSWPLDAWRMASYGTWLTICLAAYVFKTPLINRVIKPLLQGAPPQMSDFFMELILLPLMAIIGWLVIWNYRRDLTARRPA